MGSARDCSQAGKHYTIQHEKGKTPPATLGTDYKRINSFFLRRKQINHPEEVVNTIKY